MIDDLDPYLSSFFAPPEAAGDDGRMKDEIPISQEQLAKHAGQWFAHARIEDVPAKLWLDYYVAGSQLYLRATFDAGVKAITKVRLAALAVSLDEAYGTEITTIAYPHDYTWDEIEERSRELNRVQ